MAAREEGDDATDALVAVLGGKVHISRRRPDFTLPPLHRDLRLSSHAPLADASSSGGGGGRATCPTCAASRRFFCHGCLLPLVPFPRVRLPCDVYFVTDRRQRASNATGVHAALSSPDRVTLCAASDVPALDPRHAVLMFPSEDATSVAELVAARRAGFARGSDGDGDATDERERRERERGGVRAVVIVDSKWQGASLIASSPRLRNLPRVSLKRHRTSFWRFHPQPKSQEKRDARDALKARGEDDGDERVCSIEALFFFLRELHDALGTHGDGDGGGRGDDARGDDDDGTCHCFDDLLWYFAWQHKVIAEDAATREYHPIAPQRLKRRGRAAAAAAAEGDDDAFDDDDDDRN